MEEDLAGTGAEADALEVFPLFPQAETVSTVMPSSMDFKIAEIFIIVTFPSEI